MIPVRVPADRAVHTTGGVRHLTPDHTACAGVTDDELEAGT